MLVHVPLRGLAHDLGDPFDLRFPAFALPITFVNVRGHGRSLGSLVWLIWGVLLLFFKLRGTNLRGVGRDLGVLVGPILGVPLLLFN